jgi:putative transposase
MPYEYRKLTPEEKRDIVQYRRQRGYPLHAPPHPFRDKGVFLISATCFNHAFVMMLPLRRTEFELLLIEKAKSSNLNIISWVILPNHYHVLIGAESFKDISNMLQRLHGMTARKWNLEDHQSGTRRVWYRFMDRMIRNETHFFQALNYIHYNPVKHGFVKDPYDWVWSSLPLYLHDWGREELRKNWNENPPLAFGEGWDD